MDGFYSGRKVLTEADILSIPAAAASIEIITNAISDLPVQLLENVDTKQGKEAVDSDYRVDMINDSPNNILTGADFKKEWLKMLFYMVLQRIILNIIVMEQLMAYFL